MMPTTTLTPGRWRGLKTTGTDDHVFTIMAFDQRGTYEKMLPASCTYADAVNIKQEVVVTLSPYTSAVLLDPTFGIPAAMHMSRTSGILLALEETGYAGTPTFRRVEFNPNWTVNKIKNAGGDAVKLLVYYHPDAGELAAELEETVRQVAEECHVHDLPIFVEPVSYSLDANVAKSSPEFAAQRPAIVRETARRFSKLGVDVLKMEFPIDAAFDTDEDSWHKACAEVSEVATVPWVLLSAGVDFPIFDRQVKVACQNGASGFLGGRAIWKECVNMSPAQRREFLQTTAQQRLDSLNESTHKFGRPWTDFYQPLAIAADWFLTYS